MSFRFPCYRDLKLRLGELDALCECLEIAIRDLVESANGSSDPNEFMGERSRHHGVRVNRVDIPGLQAHAARTHIMTVYQSLEDFLDDLRSEHPLGDQWDMNGKRDLLTKTAGALGFNPTLPFDICQYYRLIRNAVAHPSARDGLRGSTAKVSALQHRVAQAPNLNTLDAPNPFDNVTFDDFVLFSRATKLLAMELCAAGRPSDAELRAEAVTSTSKQEGQLRKNPTRLANARSGYLQTRYSLSKSEADRIVAGLLA
ncbi:hypothetical protein ACN6A1_06260 [Myxococcus virescens]|uniref:hypothetical protein n=1 Tax=Myxococcus virescens TaxID=83456 RepID=UPI003DA3ADC4